LKNEPSALSDSDLINLNALADGELSAADTEQWKQRVSTDVHAAATYEKIMDVKKKLSSMSQEHIIGSATVPRSKTQTLHSSTPVRWAIAASIAVAIFVGGTWFAFQGNPNADPIGLIAWHEQFSTQEYVVKQNQDPLFVSLGQSTDIPVPDLVPSKLYLVDTKVIDDTALRKRAILHYRGLRGCRLTIWLAMGGQEISSEGIENLRQWLVGKTRFGIIATGMDKSRFASIAKHVETVTRKSAIEADDTRVAMGDAYKRSVSCT